MGQGDDLNDLWKFDEKNGWTPVDVHGTVKPLPRSYHAGACSGHSLFVFGGCSGHNRLNDLWRFDTRSALWELLHIGGEGADRPSIRGGAMLFAPSEKEVYVICGFSGQELDDAWRFNVETRTWTQITSPIPARSVAACANLNGRAIIFGGEKEPAKEGHNGAGLMRNDVFIFDPKSGSWTEIECDGDKPCPRGWMEWAPIDDNTLLLVGGLSEKNQRLSDAFVLQLHA